MKAETNKSLVKSGLLRIQSRFEQPAHLITRPYLVYLADLVYLAYLAYLPYFVRLARLVG